MSAPPSAGTYAAGTNGPYNTGDSKLGNEYHPFFHTNLSFQLGSFPAFYMQPFWDLFTFWKFGRCVIQFYNRPSVPTYDTATAVDASSSVIQNTPAYSRGGDAVFCRTSKTGPIPLTTGYTNAGGAGLYTNAEAIAALHLHPFYRIINMAPSRRRKFAVIRRNMASGMKPVTFKFTPTCVNTVSHGVWYSTSATKEDEYKHAYPATSGQLPTQNYRYSRSRARWNRVIDRHTATIVNPTDPATTNDDNTLFAPYHGVCVSFRPGSWTEARFPGLLYRMWVRVLFKGKQRPFAVGTLSDKNYMTQMNYGGPQINYT